MSFSYDFAHASSLSDKKDIYAEFQEDWMIFRGCAWYDTFKTKVKFFGLLNFFLKTLKYRKEIKI